MIPGWSQKFWFFGFPWFLFLQVNVVSSSKTKFSLSSLVFLFFFMTNLKLTGFCCFEREHTIWWPNQETKHTDSLAEVESFGSLVFLELFVFFCFVLLVFHQAPFFSSIFCVLYSCSYKVQKTDSFVFWWNMGRTLYFTRMVDSPLGKRLQADHEFKMHDSRFKALRRLVESNSLDSILNLQGFQKLLESKDMDSSLQGPGVRFKKFSESLESWIWLFAIVCKRF